MESNTSDLSSTLYRKVPADGAGSIRLIQLHPGSLTDELKCTVVSVDLTDKPRFEALSYVWGKPVFDAKITCNGDVLFKITSSLHDALVRLREADGTRIFWIDQICINQASIADRNAQVARMTRIYSQCENVVVWLGDVPRKLQTTLIEVLQMIGSAQKKQYNDGTIVGGNLSALPLFQMTAAQRRQYGLPNSTDPRWKVMLYLFAAHWLRRTWIVQEIALPSRVDVQIGPVIMDWKSFAAALIYVESLKILGMSFGSLSSWKAFLALSATRERTQTKVFAPLSDLLFAHRRCKASDPRDRIYGIMGLVSKENEMPAVDYEAIPLSVFIDTTVNMILHSKNFDILGLVAPAKAGRPANLPSWVPDYGDHQVPHPITKRGNFYVTSNPQAAAKFAATGQSRRLFKTNGRILILFAQVVGQIEEVAQYFNPQQDDEVDMTHGMFRVNLKYAIRTMQEDLGSVNTSLAWDSLQRKMMKMSSTYKPTGESMRDAFYMTYYEGEPDNITEEIRAVHIAQEYILVAWRILTLGHGCSWPPVALPLVIAYGFIVYISWPIWSYLGFLPVPLSTMMKYTEMMRDAMEHRLFTSTVGLIGLAPPDAVPGDKIVLLQGGRVPVILRPNGGNYRFIGEAYVHGAMYGEMMDASAVKEITIV